MKQQSKETQEQDLLHRNKRLMQGQEPTVKTENKLWAQWKNDSQPGLDNNDRA